MTIYEIDEAIQSLVDPETGELKDYEAFEALQMEREQKLDNVGAWIKDLMAQAKAIREEELALADRRKALEKKADRLKEFLGKILDGEKFTSTRCSVSFRKSYETVIDDEHAVIDWAAETKNAEVFKAKFTIVKSEVKKYLDEGIEIPGARLVENTNIQIK